MANLKISDLTLLTSLQGIEYIECVIPPYSPGTNRRILASLLNPFRGDFDPTGDVLPSSGGRYTGGAPAIGDTWRLTADYKGWRGLVQAAVNNPSSESDWNFINLTTF